MIHGNLSSARTMDSLAPQRGISTHPVDYRPDDVSITVKVSVSAVICLAVHGGTSSR